MTSYQERFRNLLLHMGKIYSAQNDTRTALLMRGLDDVVAKINPTEVSQWKDVLSDSKRMLKVWQACENATAAPIMAAEILSSIEEFSAVDVPALVISEPIAPALGPETIHHVSPVQKAVFQSPVLRAAPAPVQVAQTVTVVHKEGHVEEEEEAEEEELEVEEEEEEAEEEEAEEEEEEIEEEVVEPEEEEEEEEAEEEEAMEVEPYTHRGRKYWLDTNTKKLYAVEGDEDVGEEVGILVGGKPVFCAA